jgi:hypothetical protein
MRFVHWLVLACTALASATVHAQTAPASAVAPPTTEDIPGYPCAIQCAAGNCLQWCSYQQRCYAYCTPQGTGACYCTF